MKFMFCDIAPGKELYRIERDMTSTSLVTSATILIHFLNSFNELSFTITIQNLI